MASQFVQTLQDRQGYKLACLEEIAFSQGWLSFEELKQIAESMEKTDGGDYLKSILAEKNSQKSFWV